MEQGGVVACGGAWRGTGRYPFTHDPVIGGGGDNNTKTN